MNFDSIMPPADVITDVATLPATINGDTSGAKTKRLIDYLSRSEVQTQEMGLRTTDYEEKAFAAQLTEALRVSRGILQGAWKGIHGSDLPT
jgi:hypothetical protein